MKKIQPGGQWIIYSLPITLRMLLHFVSVEGYGYFIDEFYYLASIHHLDTGYVDHPPLSIWLLSMVVPLAGSSAFVIRSLSALAGVATIILAMQIARRMGGGGMAMLLTGMMVCLSPVFLGMTKFYSMNSLDLLLWSWIVLNFQNSLESHRLKPWLLLGLSMGLALLNKHGAFMLGAGLFAGVVLSGQISIFRRPGPYLAALLALLLFLPNMIWQVQNGAPTLEFISRASAHKNYFQPWDFFSGFILEHNPLVLPVWLTGLGALFLSGQFRKWRWLGICFLTVLGLVLMAKGKSYYLAAMMPGILAASGVFAERTLLSREKKPARDSVAALDRPSPERVPGMSATAGTENSAAELGSNAGFASTGKPFFSVRRMILYGILGIIVTGGLVLTPLSLPLLSPASYIRYEAFLGLRPPKMEKRKEGPLPQHLADMLGWQELRNETERIYSGFSEAEKQSTVIIALNYGLAGALDLMHREGRLPAVGSGHNSYYLWGPPESQSGRLSRIIFVGFPPSALKEIASEESMQKTDVLCEFCMPSRQSVPIIVVELPEVQSLEYLERHWHLLKMYI